MFKAHIEQDLDNDNNFFFFDYLHYYRSTEIEHIAMVDYGESEVIVSSSFKNTISAITIFYLDFFVFGECFIFFVSFNKFYIN